MFVLGAACESVAEGRDVVGLATSLGGQSGGLGRTRLYLPIKLWTTAFAADGQR